MGVHLFLVQILGMSKPIGLPDQSVKEISFVPDFLIKDSLGWTLVLIVIGAVCVFLTWEVGQKADPFVPTPLGIRPEWYFTFMFTTLKLVPSHILSLEGEVLAILAFLAGGLFWLAVPYIDRNAAREKKSRFFTLAGMVIVLYIAVMTALTYLVPKI
jgi:cytochrome b6